MLLKEVNKMLKKYGDQEVKKVAIEVYNNCDGVLEINIELKNRG